MANIFLGGILLLIVGVAASYIIKAKKSGIKCIGCPAKGNCAACRGSCSTRSCGCGKEK